MRFSSNKNLELYWKDEQGGMQNIIDNINTDKQFVTKSKSICISANSNVSNKNNYEI